MDLTNFQVTQLNAGLCGHNFRTRTQPGMRLMWKAWPRLRQPSAAAGPEWRVCDEVWVCAHTHTQMNWKESGLCAHNGDCGCGIGVAPRECQVWPVSMVCLQEDWTAQEWLGALCPVWHVTQLACHNPGHLIERWCWPRWLYRSSSARSYNWGCVVSLPLTCILGMERPEPGEDHLLGDSMWLQGGGWIPWNLAPGSLQNQHLILKKCWDFPESA